MDVYVYEVQLPRGVREMVTPDEDDGYTIYIDRRLSDQARMRAYLHALRHCERDFERTDVQEIEEEAHRRAKTPNVL